ncbi:MAG TPA: hypothetical protein VE465_02080 [Streptosporangiaceae bacterium]|jgi:hypothetical protein|nr:hypothetical protein [Streptosporangiaceae bacterium]
MSSFVVIGYHTIQDGLVLRWYRDLDAATHHVEALSASRNGVLVGRGVYLHTIPDLVLNLATSAYEALRDGHDEEVLALCTHRKNSLLGGRIEPIEDKGEVSHG